MLPKKSFWGKVSIECHFCKVVTLKRFGVITFIGAFFFVRFLVPTFEMFMQGRTYGEIFNGVSNSFFNESTSQFSTGKTAPGGVVS